MEDSETPKDKLGQDIVVGAYIVYAIQFGQSPDLRLGKVLKLENKKRPYSEETDIRISVQGLWDRSGGPGLIKKSTIGFPDRIVVVPESSVPAEHLRLLKDVS